MWRAISMNNAYRNKGHMNEGRDNVTNSSGNVRSVNKDHRSEAEPTNEFANNALFVGSVEKAFAVLGAFKGSKTPLSLSQIAVATGMGKSAAQRFCYTLVALGFLERDENTRLMHPGVRLLELSNSFLLSDPITSVANPYLLRARDTCGQAMNLGIPLEQDIIYITRMRSSQSHVVNPIVGGRAPLFCTSSGRAYLSTLDTADVERILDASDLSSLTRHTTTDRVEILERIDQARSFGYAMANQECYVGELTIAAPIFGAKQVGLGAINICVSLPSWSIQRIEEELAPLITQTAHEISMALSH
jgi:DNA-binding IclR family transcriptional regulator